MQQGVESSVLMADVEDASVETLDPAALGSFGDTLDQLVEGWCLS